MRAPVAVVALALLPWLALVPFRGSLGVATGAVAIACSLHGWGRLLARWRPVRVSAILAIWYGVAVAVALGGLATMVGTYGSVTQAIVVFGGVALHTAAIALDYAATVERIAPTLHGARWWLVPVGLLAAIGALAIIGAAGDIAARAFDDDGHVLGALNRLSETGTLADPVGYARVTQLGGDLMVFSLVLTLGDLHCLRAIDALAFVLVMALAIARIHPRDTFTAIWCALLVVVAAALPVAFDDPAPLWLVCGLALALFTMVADGAPTLAIGILAGALVAIRLELIPLAIVGLLAAWWPSPNRTWRRGIHLVATALCVIAPFLIARAIAWSHVPDAVRHVVAPGRSGLVLHLAVAAGVTLAASPIVALVTTGSRALGFGVAATLGTIAGGVWGPAGYSARFIWPLAFALAIAVVIEIARRGRTRSVLPFVVVVLAAVAVYEGESATGRYRWTRRCLDLVGGVGYLDTDPTISSPRATDYAAALATVPDGASVAIWVSHPELIDHAQQRIFDVRTPRTSRSLPSVLDALRPQFLLIEDEPTIASERRTRFAHDGLRMVEIAP